MPFGKPVLMRKSHLVTGINSYQNGADKITNGIIFY